MNVISTGARWISGGLAIWVGVRITIFGLVLLNMGSQLGLVLLPMAFVFFVPALLAMFGGNLNWLRGLWGIMTAASLAGLLFVMRMGTATTQTGMARIGLEMLLAYCVVGLVISFVARQKKAPAEEPEVAESFS